MLTLNFGFEKNIIFSIAQTWLLLLLVAICFVVWKAYKKQCSLCFRYVAANFNAIWYFFIMTILTVLTIYHFDAINYNELNFAAITASALIVLLFLPFFKRVVIFGIEADIVSVLEKELELNNKQKTMETDSNNSDQNKDKIDMLQKLESLKSEVKVD